ncbi:MAG TPA: helix-turn-helix transcriptional regulator [Streptosporangiaceae bacterium]|nr:helix-turn-helix transcriptional regulator [Streptosporangiaceae bacterium]
MPGLLRAADTFLAKAAATARAEDPLTGRERQVADLVAQALSNREVARTLVLSERTVESHVRSILAKTGLTSRTEEGTPLITWLKNLRAFPLRRLMKRSLLMGGAARHGSKAAAPGPFGRNLLFFQRNGQMFTDK